MLIRLANGELRDEINYSFIFQGFKNLNCFDPLLKDISSSYMFPENTSYRIQNLEIKTNTPTTINIEVRPLDDTPKSLIKVSTSHNRVFEVFNNLDLNPLQLFQVRCEPNDKEQEIFVCINGLLRRPTA